MAKNTLVDRVRLLPGAAFYPKIVSDVGEGDKKIRNGFKDSSWN